MWPPALADPELQKRGGNFSEIFERPFLGVSRKMQHFHQNVIYLPKLLVTIFSRRPFSCFNVVFFRREGGKSVADINTAEAKILIFRQIHNAIITLSAPEGGKLHCQLQWGAMAGCAPLDPPLAAGGLCALYYPQIRLLRQCFMVEDDARPVGWPTHKEQHT